MEKSLSASVGHDRQGLNGFRCFGGDTLRPELRWFGRVQWRHSEDLAEVEVAGGRIYGHNGREPEVTVGVRG